MSATQELSQWAREPDITTDNTDNTMNYTPGQPGYVGFEDLELAITQPPETQVDITPHLETRIERYPESKRFIEPETPVPGPKTNLVREASDGYQIQTPQLPINPFKNPFEPYNVEDNQGMGLTQVFKATQAGSSPMVPRRQHLASSQRPSPNIITRNVFDIPSDIVSDRSLGGTDLQEIAEAFEVSSQTDSVVSRASKGSNAERKDGDDILLDESKSQDTVPSTRTRKSRRLSVAQKRANGDVTQRIDGRMLRSVRRGNTQQNAASMVAAQEINTSEDETELEDEVEDGDDGLTHHEEDSEGDKENRLVDLDRPAQPGLKVRRAIQSAPDQNIPFSSSPALARHQLQEEVEVHDDDVVRGESPSNYALPPAGVADDEQQITIADSQSSQKQSTKQTVLNTRQLVSSSNDSRKVIPQSQAGKPQSSLHVTSTAQRATGPKSQQTMSPPPESSSDKRRHSDAEVGVQQKSSAEIPDVRKPVSPRSSPPLRGTKSMHEQPAYADMEVTNGFDDFGDVPGDAFGKTGLARRPASTLVRSTPSVRNTRFTSTVPETAVQNRYGSEFANEAPRGIANSFTAAEDIEFSFHNPSQNGKNVTGGNASLPASFGSYRSNDAFEDRNGNSPVRPRTFSAMAMAKSQSQEQESFEFAVFNTQDREMYDMIAQHPGTGSSPLGPGRKRRRGNNRQPILLDEHSGDENMGIPNQQSPETEDGRSRELTPMNTTGDSQAQRDSPSHIAGPVVDDVVEDVLEEEAIPFLDLPIPSRTYGKRARSAVKTRKQPSTTPAVKADSLSGLPKKRGRPRKIPVEDVPSVSDGPAKRGRSKPDAVGQSASENVAQTLTDPSPTVMSTKETILMSYATAPTQQPTTLNSKGSRNSVDAGSLLVPNRVFARFRGSTSAYFAATCLAYFDTELEKKYNVRFDDGTVDQMGQAFVKRLEFCVGDEVRVDRRQMKSTTFIVQGFGSKIGLGALVEEEYPITDVRGHETIKLLEKVSSDGKKRSKSAQELEIPVTEIFFTISMWSAVRDREYNHPLVNREPSGTPVVLKPTSNFTSPQSRTRSTNKSVGPESIPISFNARPIKTINPTVAASGLFKATAFVVTGVQSEQRDRLVKTVLRHGGIILDGFQELFDMPAARSTSDDSSEKEDDLLSERRKKADSDIPKGPQLKATYAHVRLAVLVSEKANRSTKYFQALALGIPCISFHWIKHCLQAGKLKNWRPYMLAAGDSTILLPAKHGISCSQQLNLTHEEIGDPNLNLATILDRRPQWLQDAKVLIVGNGEQGNMSRLQIHTFIAFFLGASEVWTAEHHEQAKQCLATKNQSFEWVCLDNEVVKEGSSLSRNDRRSKRSSAQGTASVQGLEGIGEAKVISVKLVLESLIVGNLLNQEDVKEQDE